MTQTRRRDPLQAESHWWHRFKLSTQKFGIALCILAAGLGFTYVWMTNKTAEVGFNIEKLQQQLKDAQDENERLELSAANLRALSVVDSTSEQLQLQPTDTFEVLPATGAVALQR